MQSFSDISSGMLWVSLIDMYATIIGSNFGTVFCKIVCNEIFLYSISAPETPQNVFYHGK